MPDYVAPGVYIEETGTGPQPIEGVDVSIAAFVGATAKGPLNAPAVVDGLREYEQAFGAVAASCPLSLAVQQFHANGGRECVVVRVASAPKRGMKRVPPAKLLGNAKTGTGMHALLRAQRPGILVLPDAAYLSASDHAAVTTAALAFCEDQRIFHIADVPQEIAQKKSASAAVAWINANPALRSHSGALYFPWLDLASPSGAAPPAGTVAGIYARTDATQGVWKAPAGLDAQALGLSGLEAPLTDGDNALLQAASINAIRSFPGHGTVAWGARTLAAPDDAEWQYVPVRRLGIFVERSLTEGLTWAVFEPNGEALWAQMRLAASSFLFQLFRAGAFQGTRPQDAFFVKCDATTMTQSDIDAGRLILEIGFAPVKPAEFVIIRIVIAASP